MKQTAIDYLWHELIANPGNYIKAYKQAKAMEKEQIVDAVNLPSEKRWYNALLYNNSGEQYYHKTYETSNI